MTMRSTGLIKSMGLLCVGLLVFSGFLPINGWSSAGTEGAAFLNIPVGGRPAALGSAYSALATDAYAPVYNPAGLGFLESTQLSGMHLSYLESINYEYLSFVHPFSQKHGIGFSAQYRTSGDIAKTDVSGRNVGSFDSQAGAYSLAYGYAVSERLSLGMTGKVIHSRIDDVSASAYAADIGGLYQAKANLRFSTVVTNLGSKLKFIEQGDSLPLAVKAGVAYQPKSTWQLALEGVYRKSGLASAHAGGEWQPIPVFCLRTGYKTDTTTELSAIAGLTVGMGITLWGQELSYAWVPFGELGSAQYVSLDIRFGAGEKSKRNLIQLSAPRKHAMAKETTDSEYTELRQLLDDHDKQLLSSNPHGEKR